MEQSETSQILGLRTDFTGWITTEQMKTDLEEFRCTGGAPYYLSFAGVQLEATADPVTDGVHTVRNSDRKAFRLVWLAVIVDLRVISVRMGLESMCPNDALKFSRVHPENEWVQNKALWHSACYRGKRRC